MFSAWMVGLEDEPDRCGEICIVEVFGDTVTVATRTRPEPASDPEQPSATRT